MKRSTRVTLAVIIPLAVAIALFLCVAVNRSTADSRYHGSPNFRVFDPNRDALADLHRAEAQAAAERKNILMDVGGNWCPSCIVFDQALRSDARLREILNERYVVLHVNWSSDNKNERVLKSLPSPHGYPALYVLGSNGALLVAQETSIFENSSSGSDGYDHKAFEGFLMKYGVH